MSYFLISSVPLIEAPILFLFCSTLDSSSYASSRGRQRAILSQQMELPECSSPSATSSTLSKSKIQILCEDFKIKVYREVALGLVEFDVLPPLAILAYFCQRGMYVAPVPLLSFSYDKFMQERIIRISVSARRTRVSHASTRSSLSASICL